MRDRDSETRLLATSVGARRETATEIGVAGAEKIPPEVPLRTIREIAEWHADSRGLFTFIYIFRGRTLSRGNCDGVDLHQG